MAITLEQQRAAHAWKKAQQAPEQYDKLAKGLPALIMNSGLMQVLAFLNEKGRTQPHCKVLGEHLREWLQQRFPTKIKNAELPQFMEALLKLDSQDLQQVTAETHAWLRWVRQLAPTAKS
jgi:CRISPR-associated protein Cmr5